MEIKQCILYKYVKNLGLRDVKVFGECYETVGKIVSACISVTIVTTTEKKTNISISKAYLLNSFEIFNLKDNEKMFGNHHKIVVKGL